MERTDRPNRLGKNSFQRERNAPHRDGKGYRGGRHGRHRDRDQRNHSPNTSLSLSSRGRNRHTENYRDDYYRNDQRQLDYTSERKQHAFRRPNDQHFTDFHHGDDSSNTQHQQVKPIPINLKPSGILTKYLHFQQNPTGSSSNEQVKEAGSKYAPPDDAIVPTAENCPFHLFKYNDDTKKQQEVPIFNYKSYFIFGRDAELSDIVIDKDTEDGDLVSKQHAVLQFKKSKRNPAKVDCFIMDLGSTNGTFLNDSDVELPGKRFIQLKNKDFIRFGDYDAVVEFMVVEDK